MLIFDLLTFISYSMSTQKLIVPISMDDDLLKRIDEYRRSVEGKIPSRSEAIRRLIDESLLRHEEKPRKPTSE